MNEAHAEFVRRLSALERDSRDAARVTYTGLLLRYMTERDAHAQQQITRHLAFWAGIWSALQTAAFVALGRIYEDKNTFCADRLIKFAEYNYGIFSTASLIDRKKKEGFSEAAATEFAANAFQPKQNSFGRLRQEFADRRMRFEKKFKDIRDEIYAHTGKLTEDERSDLFAQALRQDLAEVAAFPLQLHRALFHLYYNGIEPLLGPAPSDLAEVLKSKAGGRSTTWEHLHVAKDVSDFLSSLISEKPNRGN